MANEWPPPPDAESRTLLAEVDTNKMPDAKHFSACLEALANVPDAYAWNPYIGRIDGALYEVHNNGVPNADYSGAEIPVATPLTWQNSPNAPEVVSTVFEVLGSPPEHFMSFAEVLSGQDVAMTGSAGPDAYAPPIDWAYYNLAFAQGLKTGSAGEDMKVAVADFAALNSALQAVLNTEGWAGTGQVEAAAKLTALMNFLLYIRGPVYAELAAGLTAYAALVKAAREQLDGLMAQADTALLGLDAAEGNLVGTLAVLLTLAGFLPGLPYAISFGVSAASAVVSKIEDAAKAKAKEEKRPDKILIPTERSHSCVDILRWYAEQARATCQGLAEGIDSLSKRLSALIKQALDSVPDEADIPEQLRTLPS